MPVNIVKTVNFGSSKSSLSQPGYRIYSSSGILSGSRITGTGSIGEVISGSGIYSASIYITDNFTGHILWDTGESTPTYASEDIDNTLTMMTTVSSSVTFIRDHTAGRWQIDKNENVMIFYKEDNETEVARYGLFDADGTPSHSAVFERTLITGSA
tara:strand:- start:881 stop:1348 length:468 start_codon:yes stop_codon:yes gene_type:complete